MIDIHISLSKLKPGKNKSTSTRFRHTIYTSLDDLAKDWNKYSISSAIYSGMRRWDKFKNEWKYDFRRRIHNISFIGNTFIYDFDDGTISMKEFTDQYQGKFDFLIIESKNSHKYEYDRFKVLVVHDTMFVQSLKTDSVPGAYKVLSINRYQDIYIGFAEQFDFWQYGDQSTTDLCRLASNTGKEYTICHLN